MSNRLKFVISSFLKTPAQFNQDAMIRRLYFFAVLYPCLLAGQSQNQNYVLGTVYKTATSSSISSPTNSEATQNITYFDGLGRPIQQVSKGQSASGKNIVVPMEYDAFGRQLKEYLPYSTQSSDLNYVPNALSEVLNYEGYQGEPPYSEKLLESSPLSRPLKQSAPGTVWAMGSGKEIKMEYLTNTDADHVILYKANASWNASQGIYDVTLSSASYGNGQLYKTVLKDENWTGGSNNTTEEFKDKQGRIVLKRSYNEGTSHDTYYVYDQFGNLSYVLPPLVSNASSELDYLCYQYKYDYRNRLVEKRLPGKKWEFMVYDKLDRIVATGPAFSPFGTSESGWLVMKYDVYNRVAYTGWLATENSRIELQTQQNAIPANFSESRSSGSTVENIVIGYTNTIFPTSGMQLLSVSYYDDYAYPNGPTVFGGNSYYNLTQKPKGLPTGNWDRVLSTGTVLFTSSYSLYDKKGRVVRTVQTNHLGGQTSVENSMDFSGKVLSTITTHSRISGMTPLWLKEDFTYTEQDRLLSHVHQTGQNGIPQLLSKNEYDELGQLIVKRVGGTDLSGNTPLQKIDYAYNIRGWLKEINKTRNLIQSGDPDDLFAFLINYETVVNSLDGRVKPLYNGNISETFWKTSSDDTERSYGYQYDQLNRLNAALYQKSGQATMSYDEWMDYDKNGNIQHLSRNGAMDSQNQPQEIDVLEYTYHPQLKNQLMAVSDITGSPEGFKDGEGSQPLADDYVYDRNGNMVVDGNKGITRITYNHINLPVKILFDSDLNKIEYLYTATGEKVQKTVTKNGTPVITTYLGGFQYKGKKLLFFPTAEGYVNYTAPTLSEDIFGSATPESFNYVYNYTDHLGNIRLSYSLNPSSEELTVIEENHYYPFGLKHSKYNSDWNAFLRFDEGIKLRPGRPLAPLEYKYKYNGKEFQDELGLNVYDYGARNYDAAIGRWMNIDPLAEFMRSISPYNYAFNNPVYFSDSEGLIPIPVPALYKLMKWRIDSWYGERNCEGCSKFHRGLDINFGSGSVDFGAPVLATHDGIVVSIKNTISGGGRNILIQSPDGSFQTQYLHLSSIIVAAGQEISEGQTIGLIGGSGRGKEKGYAVHLHYQIKKYDKASNSYQYYNPTEGKGNSANNIVDPQSWINSNNGASFRLGFTGAFDDFSNVFNFKIPKVIMPYFAPESKTKPDARPILTPINLQPGTIVPSPTPLPTSGPGLRPIPIPTPLPIPPPSNIPFPNNPHLNN